MPEGERRLAAIMFTDMVGYTALTQSDESQAMEVLGRHNRLLRPFFPKYDGKEVKAIGDSFLVEFESALDATKCAIDLQSYLHDYNISSREEWKIALRIGIHLGDVIHQGGDVFGDAVNIASRIEPLAEAQGICISEQVYDQVRNKLSNPFERLGPRNLKNVRLPIDVYKIVMPWEKASTGSETLSADRLAVLPFANMSPDPNDEYFADGMTEELISTLSKITGLSVISRTSVSQYKKSSKPLREIGKELEVGTVIEGSVRKAGDLIRITVQALDAKEDRHIWSSSYDRSFRDVFSIQSDIAENVAATLKSKLVESVRRKVEKGSTQNMRAYNSFLEGRYYLSKATAKDNIRAIRCLEDAIKEDPNFALAYARIAEALVYQAGDSLSPSEAFPKALGYVTQALELDSDLPEAHYARAQLAFQYDWDWNIAEKEFRLAIELNPSFSLAHSWLALFLAFIGRGEEAIPIAIRGRELDPLSMAGTIVGHIYLIERRFDEGIKEFRRIVELYPKEASMHSELAFYYTQAGNFENAIEELEMARRMEMAAGGSEEDFWDYSLSGWEYAATAFAYVAMGRSDEARKILGHLEGVPAGHYVGTSNLAVVHLALGEKDHALELLEKGFRERDPGIIFLNRFPMLDGIRTDPRFISLLEKYRLGP